MKTSDLLLRPQGYEQALTAAGVAVDQSLVRYTTLWHRSNGAQAIRDLLDDGVEFDAVFGLNDALALGAMRALQESGLRIPEEVSVIGFDDIDEAQYTLPSLSTINPGRERIAALAVELLLARIRDGGARPSDPEKYRPTTKGSSGSLRSPQTDGLDDASAEQPMLSAAPRPASFLHHWMPSLTRRHSWQVAPVGPRCCAAAPSAVEHDPISSSFELSAFAKVQ